MSSERPRPIRSPGERAKSSTIITLVWQRSGWTSGRNSTIKLTQVRLVTHRGLILSSGIGVFPKVTHIDELRQLTRGGNAHGSSAAFKLMKFSPCPKETDD